MEGTESNNNSAAAENDNTITVKIQSTNGELTFRVKKTTPFSKILKAFADKNGVNLASYKFTFDGNGVKDSDTPESLDMDDGDSIDAMPMQVGGK